jgi:hypothetical protein
MSYAYSIEVFEKVAAPASIIKAVRVGLMLSLAMRKLGFAAGVTSRSLQYILASRDISASTKLIDPRACHVIELIRIRNVWPDLRAMDNGYTRIQKHSSPIGSSQSYLASVWR